MSYFTKIITNMLLYAVSVGVLHNKYYVGVIFNLFSWKCSAVHDCATNFFLSYWVTPTNRVLRQFGMQQLILRCHSQSLNIHGIILKDKHDEKWGQLFVDQSLE